MIWIFFILGTANAEILDRGYLPPPKKLPQGNPAAAEHYYSKYNVDDRNSKLPGVGIDIVNPKKTFPKFEAINSTLNPEIFPTSTDISAIKYSFHNNSIGSNIIDTYTNDYPNSYNSSMLHMNNYNNSDDILNASFDSSHTMTPLFNDLLDADLQEREIFDKINPQSIQNSIQKRIKIDNDRDAFIINYDNIITPDGYAYNYDTSNNIHVDEKGSTLNGVNAKGSYSYLGDDGKLYSVTYTANEDGFRPVGDHLPTSPPIPDAILKVIEQAYKDKEAGIVDDGSYDGYKYGHQRYENTVTVYPISFKQENHNFNQETAFPNYNNKNNKLTNKDDNNNDNLSNYQESSIYKKNNPNENQHPESKYTPHKTNNNQRIVYQPQTYKNYNTTIGFNNNNIPIEDIVVKRTESISNNSINKHLLNVSNVENTGYQYYKPTYFASQFKSEKPKEIKNVTPKPFLTPYVMFEEGNTKDYYDDEDPIDNKLNVHEGDVIPNIHNGNLEPNIHGIFDNNFQKPKESNNFLTNVNDDHLYNLNDLNPDNNKQYNFTAPSSSTKLPIHFSSRDSSIRKLTNEDIYLRNKPSSVEVISNGYSDSSTLNKSSPRLGTTTITPKFGTTSVSYPNTIREESNDEVKRKKYSETLNIQPHQVQRFDPSSGYYY